MTDTIFALSSGKGRAGVAVVRLSGPDAFRAAGALVGKNGSGCGLPEARRAGLRALKDCNGNIIDRALVLTFPEPSSFTGEDVAELHVHGGAAVLSALFAALSALGLRPAEPGEFTRRAFENGRMDLTEAEGLADLIAAETEAQRKQALRQMGGGLRTLYEMWREQLLEIAALMAAAIDFSDEDIPEDLMEEARARLGSLKDSIAAHLAEGRKGERIREGVEIVIAGPPNAGKSSLLNLLARRDAAIVSDIAGTTRDLLEVHLDLGGYAVTLVDTAGLRTQPDDPIEKEGVRRAKSRIAGADLTVMLVDATTWPYIPSELEDVAARAETLRLLNKIDITDGIKTGSSGHSPQPEGWLPLSVKTGEGVEAFLDALTRRVAGLCGMGEETATMTRARHRAHLEEALAALEASALPLSLGQHDLAAEDLRRATVALGRLTGRVDVEEVFGLIFSSFCIGK